MKTKIVHHLAGNAMHAMQSARGELTNMYDRNKETLLDRSRGIGRDFAVVCEQLDRAIELLDLLTED